MHEILRHNARMGPTRLKYLGIIQSVVTRMAANEFTTRKWSVALGSALIGWTVSRNAYPKHALVAAIPSSCFWLLDAYYLSQERCFRYIFERECAISTEPARLSLVTSWGLLDWIRAVAAPAVWLVHLPVIAIAAVVGYGIWQI